MKRIMLYIILAILAVLLTIAAYITIVNIGRSPRGARLERVRQSHQWNGKTFQNTLPTPTMTGEGGLWQETINFFFGADKNKTPKNAVRTNKVNLKDLPKDQEAVVWLGHSSLFIQTGGKRFLFDPVLTNKFPASLFMRPFRGSAVYSPEDIPEVDYLIITHNHWDHLDYPTVKALKERVGAVYCSLGIGESLAYWGYPEEKIHDMDWQESARLDEGITLHCLPARHFSGRLTGAGKTLWASYVIQSPVRTIFVTGDGGYDDHFKQIGERFPDIDLAVMENGQYSTDWKLIHMLPEEIPQAIEDIGAKRVMTYHNSKFSLANHAWNEPMNRMLEYSQGKPWKLLTPRIGEAVMLDEEQEFQVWWK